MQNDIPSKRIAYTLIISKMKKTATLVAIAIAVLTLSACNKIDTAAMKLDVKKAIQKTEQCYAPVRDDMIDSLYQEQFEVCSQELDAMLEEMGKKYNSAKERQMFDSLFFEEIRHSNVSNDLLSMMEEIREMSRELAE